MKNYLIFTLGIILLGTSCKKEIEKLPQTYDVSGQFQTVSIPMSEPPNQQMKITGTGTLSHLGVTSFEAISTLVLLPPPPFNLSGTATFTMQDQDKFYTTFTGTSTPQPSGLFLVNINHIITTGTGRFKNASGQFSGTTYTDREDPNGTITLDGQITY